VTRDAGRILASLILLCSLIACTTPRPPAAPTEPAALSWSGRLALRIDSEPAQSFSAGFELTGGAQSGKLTVFSPFGATLAELTWSPGAARLRSDGKQQEFSSVDALTRSAVGSELPIAALFRWLAGENPAVDGWQADLSQLASGRLEARRAAPAPTVLLRLVLD